MFFSFYRLKSGPHTPTPNSSLKSFLWRKIALYGSPWIHIEAWLTRLNMAFGVKVIVNRLQKSTLSGTKWKRNRIIYPSQYFLFPGNNSLHAFFSRSGYLAFSSFCACAQLSGHGLDLLHCILDGGDLFLDAEIQALIDENLPLFQSFFKTWDNFQKRIKWAKM